MWSVGHRAIAMLAANMGSRQQAKRILAREYIVKRVPGHDSCVALWVTIRLHLAPLRDGQAFIYVWFGRHRDTRR